MEGQVTMDRLRDLLQGIDTIGRLAEKAVPGAEWFKTSDLAEVSFIDASAAKLIAALTPDCVLELCSLARKGLAAQATLGKLHADVSAIECDDSLANEEWSDRRTAYCAGHEDALRTVAALSEAAQAALSMGEDA